MSSLNNNADKARMAASILLTLPGSPYLYYGEEIGMLGKKPDQGIREPFMWDTKDKDKSRTTWEKPFNSNDSTIIPLNVQVQDQNSLFNHYKKLIQLRNSSTALTYGELEPVNFNNSVLSAFVRTGDDPVLVMHNTSGVEAKVTLPDEFAQYTKIFFRDKNASLKNRNVSIPAFSSLLLKK
jgi:glycosidase